MKLQRILLMSILIFLTFIGGSNYADGSIFILISYHLVVSVGLIVWLGTMLLRGRQLHPTPLDLPIFAYVVWLLITALLSDDWRIALQQSWQYIAHALGFYLVVTLIRQGRQRWLFEALFLIAALIVLISILELVSWYFGLGFGTQTANWFAIGGLSDPIPPDVPRLSIALNVATRIGNYVILVLPLAFIWSLTARRRPDRQALWGVCAGLLFVLLFSQSRAAVIGFGVSILLMGGYWFLKNMSRLPRWIKIGAPLGIVLAVVISVGSIVLLRGGAIQNDDVRLGLWQGALDIAADHPVFGVGVSQYPAKLPAYDGDNRLGFLTHAHNLYLNTAAEVGVPGLLLMLWMAIVFLRVWFQRYQSAWEAERWRLVGILAALSAFAVQSLFDTFTHTSSVIPILVMVGYVMAYAEPDTTPAPAIRRLYRAATVSVLAMMLAYGIWLARTDLASFHFFLARAAVAQDDYPLAMERLDRAQALDGENRFYDFQEAYLLGALANDDPDQYLNAAIEAYQALVADVPHYDVAWVNLAALYAQAGDYPAATDTIQNALDPRADDIRYHLLWAHYAEQAGDPDAAQAAYAIAFDSDFDMNYDVFLYSPLMAWQPDSAPYQAAFAANSAQSTPAEQVWWAAQNPEAPAIAPETVETTDMLDTFLLGLVAYRQGDYELASRYFQAVMDMTYIEEWLVAEAAAYQAEIHLQNGDINAARDALIRSRFAFTVVPHSNVAEAKILIAEDSPEDGTINRLLASGVPPIIVRESYLQVSYRMVGTLTYIPQVPLLGWQPAAYDPWLLLAERLATDDDPETDPVDVYQVILDRVPDYEAVRELCGDACAE